MAEVMNAKTLKQICKDNKLYTTPYINDKIYLHYKGFRAIENLEEYTGLTCVWLEGNGFTKMEGLDKQTKLRSLYLHENCFEKIENLEYQTQLDTLNVSKNCLKKIENLSHMKLLTSLNVSHNYLKTADDLRHVLEIPSLNSLDLQHNKIEDPEIVDILAQLPDLRVVYLMGNPVVKFIKNYRRTVVARCPQLKYLDDRPVFDDERRRVTAWYKVIEAGGTNEEALEAERNEIKVIRQEKQDAEERNFKAFEAMMLEGKKVRLEREQAEAAVRDKNEDGVIELKREINPFSGEEIIPVPESECLRDAREARWGVNTPKFDDRLAQSKLNNSRTSDCNEKEIAMLDNEGRSNKELWNEIYQGQQSASASSVPSLGNVNRHAQIEEEEAVPEMKRSEPQVDPTKRSTFMSLLTGASAEVAAEEVKSLSTKIQIEEIDEDDVDDDVDSDDVGDFDLD